MTFYCATLNMDHLLNSKRHSYLLSYFYYQFYFYFKVKSVLANFSDQSHVDLDHVTENQWIEYIYVYTLVSITVPTLIVV